MNKTLERAFERIRALPPDRQEYVAAVLEEIAAEGSDLYQLSDEERALLREGLADHDAGRVVPAAEMTAFWNRHQT